MSHNSFTDDHGRECLRDCFVLFLDLLGTRGVRTGPEALSHLMRVKEAVDEARAASFSYSAEDSDGGMMQWFSDNLSVAYVIEDGEATDRLMQLAVETAYLQLAFVNAGLWSRGAIARGLYFRSNTFIYGPALERAVVLEHDRAGSARCVLDEASAAVASAGLLSEDSGATGSCWRRFLTADADGSVFVDYLGIAADDPAGYAIDLEAVLTQHRDSIRDNLHRFDGVPTIESKFRWLAGYHNFVVSSLGTRFPEASQWFLPVSHAPSGFRRFAGMAGIRQPSSSTA